jgi:hypothetical protein
MQLLIYGLALLAPLPGNRTVTRVCLAPASIEANTGAPANLVDAVRDGFTSFLTGPSLQASALTARLQSQARLEAKAADCPYVLFTTLKHVRKSGGGFLHRVMGSAAEAGAMRVGASSGSVAGQVAADAAAGAARMAAYDLSSWVNTKDELVLSYRLESAAGKTVLESSAKRKAQSDGEDLLTPLVETASEAIAEALAKDAP